MLLWKSQHSILSMTPLLLACCYNCSGAPGLWGRERQGVHRERRHSLAFCRVGRRNFCTEATLPETNFLPPKIGRAPKGNDCIPTIHFQVRTVSLREGIDFRKWEKLLVVFGTLDWRSSFCCWLCFQGRIVGWNFFCTVIYIPVFFNVSPFSGIPHGSSSLILEGGWQLESLIFHDVIMSCFSSPKFLPTIMTSFFKFFYRVIGVFQKKTRFFSTMKFR